MTPASKLSQTEKGRVFEFRKILPPKILKTLEKFQISVEDLLLNTAETLKSVPLSIKLSIFAVLFGAGIEKIIGQTPVDPTRPTDTLNIIGYNIAIDQPFIDNNTAAERAAFFKNWMETAQQGWQSDIRLIDFYGVQRYSVDTTDFIGSGAKGTDAMNYHTWVDNPANNCDSLDIQVFQTGIPGYEAFTPTIGPVDGFILVVSSGGSDWGIMVAHEGQGHGTGALDGAHNQARMNIEHTSHDNITNITYGPYNDGKTMGATNTGGAYLDIFTTPTQYNVSSVINGGDGTYRINYAGTYNGNPYDYTINIPVDQMHNNTGYECTTTGIYQLYSSQPYRVKKEALGSMDSPLVNINGSTASLGNETAFAFTYPNTTDPAFQNINFTEPNFSLHLYDANGNPVQTSDDLSHNFTNLDNGFYYLGVYEEMGNRWVQSSTFEINVDTEPPTGDITSDVEGITNLPQFEVSFNFSEPINTSTFSLSDISKTNCNLSGLTWNPTNDTATVTVAPGNDSDISLWINANKFKDLAGNWNTAIASWSITYDGTGSEVVFTTPEHPQTNENPVSFTMTITEDNGVVGLEQSDIDADGGTVSNWNYAGGNSATFDLVTDGTNGDYSVSIAEGAFVDGAGNNNQSSTLEGELDYEAPYSADGFQCSVGDLTNLSSFPMSIQFNEILPDFTAAKLNKDNCTVTNFQDNGNGNYSWDVNPGSNGLVSISLDAGVCHDFTGGNGNIAVPAWTTTFDGTDPTGEMVSTEISPTNADIIPVEGTVCEIPFGFDETDLIVENGSLQNVDFAGQTFGFDIIPVDDGAVIATVSESSFTDEAGNPNESFSFTIVSDRTAPLITINGPASIYSGEDAEMTYTANEDITDFDNSDILVDNGESINFSGNGDFYSSLITGAGIGQSIINISGSYYDVAGNEGMVVEEFVIDIITGVSESTFKSINIYPNPTHGILFIDTWVSAETVSVLDMTGSIVQQLVTPEIITQFDLSDLPSGIYYLKLNFEEDLKVFKLIKN